MNSSTEWQSGANALFPEKWRHIVALAKKNCVDTFKLILIPGKCLGKTLARFCK